MKIGSNIITDGLVFGYDADDRSTRFYKGEPTTNYVVGNGYYGDGTNQTIGAKGGVEITDDSLKYNGLRTILWTPGIAYNWYVHSTNLSSSTSTVWTFSCFVKRDDGGTLGSSSNYIRCYMYYPSSDGSSVVEYEDMGDGWYRVYRTRIGTINSITLAGLTGLAPEHKFYISGWVLEKKSHPTQPININTTRLNNQSLYNFYNKTPIELTNVSFDNTAHPYFDGTDDYIDTGYGANLNMSTTTISICLIIKTNDINLNTIFLSSGQTRGNANSNARFYFSTYNGYWDMGINTSSWGGNTTAPVTTEWTHIGIVSSGSLVKLYVNGIYKTQKSYTSFLLNDNILLGRHDPNSYHWNGYISNVRIYNKILNDDDILFDFNQYKKRFNI